MELETVVCPVCSGHQRAGKRLTDLNVVLSNDPVEDFVWTWYSECMLHDRVLDIFRRHEFSGLEVKPVAARFENSPEPPPTLWELVVTGWAGMAHPDSGIRLDDSGSCKSCGLLHYTEITDAEQLIDQSRWDGSDFFMVWPLPRFVFVTKRVANVIRDHHLTGVRIQPVSELKPSPHVIPGYSPGRLSYWMPEKRARELGEPLGIY
jgi:hypothetical protein